MTVHPTVEDCGPSIAGVIRLPTNILTSLSNDTNQIFMVDTTGWRSCIVRFPQAAIDPHLQCVYRSVGCVLSQNYEHVMSGASLPLIRYTDSGTRLGGSTDMYLSRARLSSAHSRYDPNIPGKNVTGGNGTYDEGDVIFNMCQPRVSSRDDVDSEFFHVYKSVLHEAGHTLGLSGFSYGEAARGEFYEMSHPTIPDSVMNYDDEPDENLESNGTHVRFEPDCAPTRLTSRRYTLSTRW